MKDKEAKTMSTIEVRKILNQNNHSIVTADPLTPIKKSY